MPDVRDLLSSAAGDPVAPLDLDDVLRRGARRTTRRRVTTGAALAALPAAGVVLALALSSGPGSQALVPADSAPAPTAPLTEVAEPAPTSSADPTPSAAPTPSPAPTVEPAGPADDRVAVVPDPGVPGDETFYALFTGVDENGEVLTYDRVEYRGEGCLGSDVIGAPDLVPACYTNVNPLLRTASLLPDAVVVAVDSSGLLLDSSPDELVALLRDPGFVGLADRPYLLTVRDGAVVFVEGQLYEAG